MVQLFFAQRIYRLTRNIVATMAIVVFSLLSICGIFICPPLRVLLTCSLAGALAVSIQMSSRLQFEQFEEFQTWGILWLAAGTVSDTIIAVVLVSYLVRPIRRFVPHRSGFISYSPSTEGP
jgi:hypothetical protein